jgi:hypothetical protein
MTGTGKITSSEKNKPPRGAPKKPAHFALLRVSKHAKAKRPQKAKP